MSAVVSSALRALWLGMVVVACGDRPSTPHAERDAATIVEVDGSQLADGSVHDASPGCGLRTLGPGLSASVAFADDHFAVVHSGPSGELELATFTESGLLTGTDTLSLGAGISVIAGQQTSFLAAYAIPDTSVGVVPVTVAGGLGTPIPVATGDPWQMNLEVSPSTGEFALIYDDIFPYFARFASDGTLAFGPVQLAVQGNQYVRGFTYRPGGWALASQAFDDTMLVLIDDNGAIERTVLLHAAGNVWLGGITWTGSQLLLSWWAYPDGGRVLRFDATGERILPDFVVPSTTLNWPRGIAVAGDGYVLTTSDTLGTHVIHADGSGTTLTDHVVGPQAWYHFHDAAVAPSGARGASWHTHTSPHTAMFAIDCP